MNHAPSPTRTYRVRNHDPLVVYSCICGAIFFVMENALTHLEKMSPSLVPA